MLVAQTPNVMLPIVKFARDSSTILLCCRCHLDVQLCIQHSSSSSQASNSTYSPSAVQAAVEQLQRNLLTQQLACVSEALGQQQQPVLITSSAHASIQDLLSNHSSSSPPCISLLPLQHTGNNGNSSAPMFEYEPNKQQQDVTSLTLGLDVLCYAPGSMPASQVMQSLIAPAVKAQLATMQQQLIQQVADGQPLTPIRAHHFQPPGLGSIPVSICYPMLHPSAETTELKLVGVRQQLHQLLGLPDNVPMLRFSNALSWEAGAAGSESQGVPRAVRLKNVHEGLTSPGWSRQDCMLALPHAPATIFWHVVANVHCCLSAIMVESCQSSAMPDTPGFTASPHISTDAASVTHCKCSPQAHQARALARHMH